MSGKWKWSWEFEADFATGEADVANGGVGDDDIYYGSNDTLTGGAGEDNFVGGYWVDADEAATITDFDPDEDMLIYSYKEGSEEPEITIGTSDDGDAQLLADGELVVTLLNVAQGDVDPGVVRLFDTIPL